MPQTELIFNTPTQQWTLRFDGAVWRIESAAYAMVLASFLNIQYNDNNDNTDFGLPKGQAELSNISNKDCIITFKPFDMKEKPRSLKLTAKAPSFYVIKAKQGLFDDGWAEPVLNFDMENISTLGLSLFLPISDIATEKGIDIILDDDHERSIILERGRKQEIWIETPFSGPAKRSLSLVSDYKEINNNDARELAFLIDKINPNNTGWTDVGEAL